MVIFQYNLYIFGIHLWTVLYPKPCYNNQCYKEVVVYNLCMKKGVLEMSCESFAYQIIHFKYVLRKKKKKEKKTKVC